MLPEERTILIDQLDRSFTAMPRWVKITVKHALGAPVNNPETGLPFKSFKEVIEAASDETLLTLKNEFEENDDLLPIVPIQ